MKQCTKCLEVKEPIEFYKKTKSKDGLQNICKLCMKSAVSNAYYSDRAKKLNYCKDFYQNNKESIKEKTKKYKKDNPRKCQEYTRKCVKKYNYKFSKKWASKNCNKIKISCQKKVEYAVKIGNLAKSPVCEICGEPSTLIDGHHWDYSKPLDVVWCCRKCHKYIHSTLE